jgi:hypothetical protein
MLIMADGQDSGTSFEERRQILESRDIARAAWKLQPQNVIDRGSAAYMACKIIQYKGGVNRIIFGSWGAGDRRYAYNEAVYRGLLTPGGMDYSPMTGTDMTALLARTDEAMRKRGVYQMEDVELGPEPPPGQPVGTGAGG